MVTGYKFAGFRVQGVRVFYANMEAVNKPHASYAVCFDRHSCYCSLLVPSEFCSKF